jgi:hypothetical protein
MRLVGKPVRPVDSPSVGIGEQNFQYDTTLFQREALRR